MTAGQILSSVSSIEAGTAAEMITNIGGNKLTVPDFGGILAESQNFSVYSNSAIIITQSVGTISAPSSQVEFVQENICDK